MKTSVQPSVAFNPEQYSQNIGHLGTQELRPVPAAVPSQFAPAGGFPIGAPYFREGGQSPLLFGGK